MSGGAYSPSVQVGLAAATVALKARAGQLTMGDVDELRERAEQLLTREDPVYLAVTWFATQFMQSPDPDQLMWLGGQLLERLGETPKSDPWAERADLNG
jgi:hypothetical protein